MARDHARICRTGIRSRPSARLPRVIRRTLSLCVLVLFCVCFPPLTGRSEEAPPALPDPAVIRPSLEGRIRLDYDYRSLGDETDSDFYGYWNGGVNDLAGGRLDLYASGRLHNELDGASPFESTFWGLDNADGVSDNRVLQAYLDMHDTEGRASLIVGRQYVNVADYLHFDGAQVVLFENGTFGGRVYAGRPVSYYSHVSGDKAAGLSLVGRPWPGNRTRLTFSEYDEDRVNGIDRNVLLDSQQEMAGAGTASGRLSILNDEFRMGSLDFFLIDSEDDSNLRIGGSRWGDYEAETRMYSVYNRQLGTQKPYSLFYVKGDYSLDPKWMLSPGVSVKRVDGGNGNYSNRGYLDYELSLIYEPIKAVSSSLGLRYWDVEEGDDFLGLFGEIRYRHSRVWEVSLGGDYVEYFYRSDAVALYDAEDEQTDYGNDSFYAEQSPYVLTYYMRMKWNVTRRVALRLWVDVEDDKAASDLGYRGRGSVEVRF